MSEPKSWESLSSIEDFLDFFDIPYDERVINVNRLHIMKKFAILAQEITESTSDAIERLDAYREALVKAYEIFLTSSATKERLFQVQHRHDSPPVHFLGVYEIRNLAKIPEI